MGIDIDRFVDVSPELVCCICTGVLEDPVESPCRHVFCSECISKWLQNNSNCPTCRSQVRAKNLKPVLPLVRNIISKLKIHCDFKTQGCKAIVSLESLRRHATICVMAPVTCTYANCGKVVPKKDLDKHRRICPLRTTVCIKGCGLEMLASKLHTHNCIKELKKKMDDQGERIGKLEDQVKYLQSALMRLEEVAQVSSPRYSPERSRRQSSSPERSRGRRQSSSPERSRGRWQSSSPERSRGRRQSSSPERSRDRQQSSSPEIRRLGTRRRRSRTSSPPDWNHSNSPPRRRRRRDFSMTPEYLTSTSFDSSLSSDSDSD